VKKETLTGTLETDTVTWVLASCCGVAGKEEAVEDAAAVVLLALDFIAIDETLMLFELEG